MGWRRPVFIAPSLPPLLTDTHCTCTQQYNSLLLCILPVMHHCNKICRRQMGKWPVSVFGSKHTNSTGTCSIERFHGVILQIEPLVLPMVRWPLTPHYCHPSIQPDFHNLRLMRAITGWFALDRWVVTCVNMEWKSRDRPVECILKKHITVICDHLFDLAL